jgi:UV DNA damage endonuclease
VATGRLQVICARIFAPIGETARRLDVRLSFHPGQFCVLASENPGIVERVSWSLNIMQIWHVGWDTATWHFSRTLKSTYTSRVNKVALAFALPLQRLSPEARNCITIENDENAWGSTHLNLWLSTVALVLDLHHHWIRTGEYIQRPTIEFRKGY